MSDQTPDPFRAPDGSNDHSGAGNQPQQPPQYGQQPAYGQQQPQYGQQPGYPQAPGTPGPYGQQQDVAAPVPGKTMGIIGLILAFFLPIVGLVLSIVAYVQSKKAGASNGPALAGIILGAIFTILAIIAMIVIFAVMGDIVNGYLEACMNGAGSFTIDGEEYVCE